MQSHEMMVCRIFVAKNHLLQFSSVQKAESPKWYLMSCGAVYIVSCNVCILFVGNLFESLFSPPNLNNNIVVDAEVSYVYFAKYKNLF